MTKISKPKNIRASEILNLEHLHTLILNPRQLCDIELILNGGFSPLNNFMSQEDYQSVLNTMHLANGSLWPIPITLDISKQFADTLSSGEQIALVDIDQSIYAILTVEDMWEPQKKEEALAVYGTDDISHPGVAYLLTQAETVYVSGELTPITIPYHADFKELRQTPAELKKIFTEKKWHHIIGFQTRNPMHRAHFELTLRASQQWHANLLLHPVVGMTKPGDVNYFTRVKCYRHILSYYPKEVAMLSLLPLAMRMAGPREALWHAIIRKNYGCTGFIVGRDHAGPGNNSHGESFYAPYAAQELAIQYQKEIGIQIIPFQEMLYVKELKSYVPANELNSSHTALKVSGTELRQCLKEGKEIPDWFSYPEVIAELRKLFPLKKDQGFTIYFTGLSGAGKSTLAKVLQIKLLEKYHRQVTLLDGDIVRKILSTELGFSHEHRKLNIQRIAYVASEVTKHRGIAICAQISPYTEIRREVRKLISEHGGFIEVYLSTPMDVCEKRDVKGFYQKAKSGLIKDFTGIGDAYEIPETPEITIDTSMGSIEDNVDMILKKILLLGYLPE